MCRIGFKRAMEDVETARRLRVYGKSKAGNMDDLGDWLYLAKVKGGSYER